MKLNYELIRNLLLTAEEKTEDSSLNQSELDVFISTHKHTKTELIYHLNRLEEANFISTTIQRASNEPYIYYLNYITWEGHQFLDTIRPKTVWETSTAVAKDLSIKSVSAFSQIAFQVASNLINSYLASKI